MIKTEKGVIILGGSNAAKRVLSNEQKRQAELWKAACDNRKKLNGCKQHKFNMPRNLSFGVKIPCVNCGGMMDAVNAFSYTQGYQAAGGDPNDIIEGFRLEPDEEIEEPDVEKE